MQACKGVPFHISPPSYPAFLRSYLPSTEASRVNHALSHLLPLPRVHPGGGKHPCIPAAGEVCAGEREEGGL